MTPKYYLLVLGVSLIAFTSIYFSLQGSSNVSRHVVSTEKLEISNKVKKEEEKKVEEKVKK
jgi:hypothetical protein